MPRVEFEPTIPVSQKAKAVHALDGAATVIGLTIKYQTQIDSRQADYN
jgi:hypothetical protein